MARDTQGNLYLADPVNNRVRRVDAITGIIETVAGTGEAGFGGDGAPARQATLSYPVDVAVSPSGDVFVADQLNHRVRRIDAGSGVITTFAGVGVASFSGDGGPAVKAGLSYPAGVALDPNGNLLIADNGNHRIRGVNVRGVIDTVAGTSGFGFNGDGQPATQATLTNPTAAISDAGGNLFIADTGNCRIRWVDAATGLIATVAGTDKCGSSGDGGPATAAQLNGPGRLALSGAAELFVVEQFAPRVRRVDLATGLIDTVAGTGQKGSSGDGGPAVEARLATPCGLLSGLSSPSLRIADMEAANVRLIDPAGVIDTVVGGANGDGFPADIAHVNPSGVALDVEGNVYIADTTNSRIRRIDAATWIIDTIAGTGIGAFSGDGGPAFKAELNYPVAVVLDNVGNVFFTDQFNQRVRRIDAASGVIDTVAGNGTAGFGGDGIDATTSSLAWPAGLALGPDGGVLIADNGNHRIRLVDTGGVIHTIAGTGSLGYNGDGQPATAATLTNPEDVLADVKGNLYIADSGNCRVRRVDAASGLIATLAGNGKCGFRGDGGPAIAAELNRPSRLAMDGGGHLFFSEAFAPRVRMVDLATGRITTVAGTGIAGSSGDGGPAVDALLSAPRGLAVDPFGPYLDIADANANNVRRVELLGAGTFSPTPTRTSTPLPPTGTPVPTATPVPSSTPTHTPSLTATRTFTRTPTRTRTSTPTRTFTRTRTRTRTLTATRTFTRTPTATRTFTPTAAPTRTPTSTPTFTLTFTLTATRTATSTATETATASPCWLDVDGSGAPPNAATDMVYIGRHLVGLPPVPASFRLLDPDIPPDTTIAANIDAAGARLDVDGNGAVNVATDAVYTARHLLGLPPVPGSFRVLDPGIPDDGVIAAAVDSLCPLAAETW